MKGLTIGTKVLVYVEGYKATVIGFLPSGRLKPYYVEVRWMESRGIATRGQTWSAGVGAVRPDICDLT